MKEIKMERTLYKGATAYWYGGYIMWQDGVRWRTTSGSYGSSKYWAYIGPGMEEPNIYNGSRREIAEMINRGGSEK